MFCQTVVSEVAAFTALHMALSESVPSIRFLLWSCNYGCMLGKILQTVGERKRHFIMMVMQGIILWCALVSPLHVCAHGNHLSLTMAVVTTTVREQ